MIQARSIIHCIFVLLLWSPYNVKKQQINNENAIVSCKLSAVEASHNTFLDR